MISRIQPDTTLDISQLFKTAKPGNTRTNSSFRHSMIRAMDTSSTNGQPGGNSVTPPMVVQSPFNILGLPVSTTPAPTAAEVAANPLKYAGTSFDPNRGVSGPCRRDEWGAGSGPDNTPASPPAPGQLNASRVPDGSQPTMNPNVFVMPSGATWFRPGTTPNNATDGDYQNWMRTTFG